MPPPGHVSPPQGPWKLVTVNTAPERAKRLIGRMIDILKEQYTITHAANVEGTLANSTM
jgi:hypothetical protein